jgi:hypothetical protein
VHVYINQNSSGGGYVHLPANQVLGLPPLLLSNFVLHQHRRISLPLPDPLFFLLPCTRSPEHRAGDLTLRRRSNSSQTEVPPLLLPRQEHHQHHISTPKLPDQFPSPSCTPVAGTPSPPSEPHCTGSVSSRTATSELPFYNSSHPQVLSERFSWLLQMRWDHPPFEFLR